MDDLQSTATPNSISGSSLLMTYGLGVFGVICFGATLPITRLALQDFSPTFITFARAGVAAFLAFSVLKFHAKPLHHPDNWQIFLGGLFVIFGFPGFMAMAMKTVSAAHGGVILSFLPLLTALLARIFAGESPSVRFWILSLTGGTIVALYILFSAEDSGSKGITAGDLWLLIAGASAAAGYVIFGKLSRETPGWEIISRALVLNLPLVLPGIWLFYEPRFLNAGFVGITSLIYLGIFSMFLGFFAWNVALARGGIARIGQLQLLQTFITIAFAALLVGESVDGLTLGTALLITIVVTFTRKF